MDTDCSSNIFRFSQVVDTAEIEKRKKERAPKNTRYANAWHLNVWRDWGEWRNKHIDVDKNEKYRFVPNIDDQIVSDGELGYWLSRFVLEIRRHDGEPYPPDTLFQICCGIQRHLRKFKCDLEIFNERDVNFNDFYASLESKTKELTGKGIGIKHKYTSYITEEDEDQLWDSGTVSLDRAEGLLHGVFLYSCKTFGLHRFDEHRTLTPDQFVISYDQESRREKITFNGKTRKNRGGGIKSKPILPKVVEHFHQPSNPRCVVTLFKKYLSLIPSDGAFYRRPIKPVENSPPTFSIKPVGVNTLKTMMKGIFEKAGISTQGRHITNRSGKVELSTNLYNGKFDDQSGKSSSDRLSNAVEKNKRPLRPTSEAISATLQPPKSSRVEIASNGVVATAITTALSPTRKDVGIIKGGLDMTATAPISDVKSAMEIKSGIANNFSLVYKLAKDCGSKKVYVMLDGTICLSVD